jgi:hypothetical protein
VSADRNCKTAVRVCLPQAEDPMMATIQYQIATYSGTVEVFFDDPDADNDYLIACTKRQLRQSTGAFPLGTETFRVISRSAT